MGGLALCLSVSFLLAMVHTQSDETTNPATPNLQELVERLTSIIKIYGQTLSWQQQLAMEKTRMDGDSGLMQVRNVFSGTRPWLTNMWARSNGQAAIHDHSNNIRTVGMGEFVAVMNGVTFRTRHNDYRLSQAHRTSTDFGATEPVDFPPIPPSVLAKPTVAEQIAEMREYFLAFKTQNIRHRDYRPYFKPVLTYMQGLWTVDSETVDEPFFSDRHSIEAETYFQLQQDIMFGVWSGRKDPGENRAVLPTMVYGVNEDGSPRIAQFSYKILVHPLETDVPLNRFRVVDDLSQMMRSFKSLEKFTDTRSARFQLHPQPSSTPFDGIYREESTIGFDNFLEELMTEVPGLNNYPADIPDTNFGDPPLRDVKGGEVLNAGYYHRYYSLAQDDASGFSKATRGYADANLFVALNNRSNIFPISVRRCSGKPRNCVYEEVKASYAMPLEILYLTPLNSWNPYNISIDFENRKAPIANGRTGRRNDSNNAYAGASEIYYYLTPAEFFEGTEIGGDTADTVRDSVYILDSNGDVRKTVASGMRIFLPNIPDVGSIRTRYPIFGVHQEGSGIFKELTALKDLVRHGSTYAHLYENPLGGLSTSSTSGSERFTFALRTSAGKNGHVHTFQVSANQITAMKEGVGNPGFLVQVETSNTARHSHTLLVRMKRGVSGVLIYMCGEQRFGCSDGHPNVVDCLDCPLGFLDPK